MWFIALLQIPLFFLLLYVLATYFIYRNEEMPKLSTLGWDQVDDGVLIIVPAKDEADSIGLCLERLMQLNGLSKYKVVAVNDRSEDNTEMKMREVAQKFPGRIEVVTIKELPQGWLGKNHACWTATHAGVAAMPDAKYFLFTDGDLRYHPDTVAESITWMKKKNIDFLTLTEDSDFEGVLEPSYLLLFGMFLIFCMARPWLLFRPNGRNHMGNGAYLLLRRDVYEKTGGHKTLRLEVVEDMKTGLLVRSQGFRCAVAVGLDRIRRRWQPGFVAVFRGLIKNFFAAFDYNIGKAVGGMIIFPLVFTSPWLCVFFGYAQVGVPVIILLAIGFFVAGQNARPPWIPAFLLSPFLAFVGSANIATSMWKTLRDGGVTWRKTTYPLVLLKEHCLTEKKAFSAVRKT